MSAHGRKNADPLLIAALAGGQTIVAAAKSAGVSERTVRRRLQEPGFRQEVQATRTQMVSEATGFLARASSGAAATLVHLLKAESEQVRLGAARSILELGARLREGEEFERRLASLEEMLNESA